MRSFNRLLSHYAVVSRSYGAAPFLIAVLIAIYGFLAPGFLTLTNIRNVFQQASVNCILAIGLTGVMLISGIDVSVGAVLALSSVVLGLSLRSGFLLEPALIAALLVCSLIGILNGVATLHARIPAFVATLASMSLARGLALTLANGRSIALDSSVASALRQMEIAPIPLSVLTAIVLSVVVQAFLTHTPVGRHVYAAGDNPIAAARQGISLGLLTVCLYLVSAILAALGGIFISLRLSSSQPIYGYMYELDAIAAAVVGGVSLQGGRGHVLGASAGAVTISLIRNGLTLLNIDVYLQHIAVGCILLLAARFYVEPAR
jgi:ribose/xylose/arabinose/galactoside ABC-type transport system permease subunit